MRDMSDVQVVDVNFPLRGESLPLDHGYALLGALARLVPQVHEHASWGVHPVLGQRSGLDRLALTPQSRLRIRLPASEIGKLLPLATASLELDGHRVSLGFPQVVPLTPAAHLRARLVTVKGFMGEPGDFLGALRRQLDLLEGLGQPAATIEAVIGPRRILHIKDNVVVGFAVGLTGLGVAASLRIQERGLGGRRHMGAGIFVPPGRRG